MANRLIPVTITKRNSIPLVPPVVDNIEADGIIFVQPINGRTVIQWKNKTLSETNNSWTVQETLSEILALLVMYEVDTPIIQVNVTKIGGYAIGNCLINAWLCDNLRTYVDSNSVTQTLFDYPLTTGNLAETIQVEGDQAAIRTAGQGGGGSGGGNFTTDVVLSVDGTGTYTFPSLTGTAYIVRIGNQWSDPDWTQSGNQITFDPVLAVDGLPLTVFFK